MKRSRPIRMCIGCGKRDAQDVLLRFAHATSATSGVLLMGRRPGRGAYLHASEMCVGAFRTGRSGFVRSLRTVLTRETRERFARAVEQNHELRSKV